MTIEQRGQSERRAPAIRLILPVVLLLLPPAFAIAQSAPVTAQYQFTDLDVNLPSTQDVLFGCAATGINDEGLIVGGCNDANQDSAFRGFLYDGRKFSEIYFPTVKGSAALAARSIYQYAPYVHNLLPLLLPTVHTVTPQDINIQGQITGWFVDSSSGIQGFLRANGNVSKVVVPNSNLTEATGINDAGHVVGDYRGVDGVFRGFLFASGVYTTFGYDLGPHDINNAEQIVGCYALCSHGFFYNGSTFVSIDVPGAVSTQASGINDVGQIVGNYYDGTTLRGFIYDGITFATISVPGAFLTDVFRINNDGTIVGFYVVETSPNVFEDHAFVATPPPPS